MYAELRTTGTQRIAEEEHMKGKNLKEAFKSVIMQEKVWKPLRIGRQTVMNRRVQVRKGIFPTEPVMRRLLKRVGWVQVVEERWTKR